MLRKSMALVAACVLAGCATSAKPKPSDFVISQGKSGLMVRAENFDRNQTNSNIASQWLTLMEYDPDNVDEDNRPSAKTSLSEIRLKVASAQDGYLFKGLKPGHYIIRGFVQQDFWQSCFHDSSIKFEVKPNTIAYLGTWNVAKNAQQLQREVRSAGQTRSNMSHRVFYFENILPPQISAPIAGELDRVKSFVSNFGLDNNTPVIKSNFEPIKFNTSKNLFGQRTC
jgi:hypothetical protein